MNETPGGKQENFLNHYEPVSIRLSKFIRSQVWNTEDARDLASETVLIAWQKFDKIESPEVFLYYLFSIASRLIRQRYRSSREHPEELGIKMEFLKMKNVMFVIRNLSS